MKKLADYLTSHWGVFLVFGVVIAYAIMKFYETKVLPAGQAVALGDAYLQGGVMGRGIYGLGSPGRTLADVAGP